MSDTHSSLLKRVQQGYRHAVHREPPEDDQGPVDETPSEAHNDRLRELFHLELKVEEDDQENLLQQLKTVVFMTNWIKSDLKIEGEMQELARTLTTTFDYDVTRLGLGIDNPQKTLMDSLSEYIEVKLKAGHKRLIFYYGGHGLGGALGELWLRSMRNQSDPCFASLDWEPIERMLKMTAMDVLIILDCCHAGNRPQRRFILKDPDDVDSNVHISREKLAKERKFEVLCAAGASKETVGDSRTPDHPDLPSTFTQALTWALTQLADGAMFTTSLLLQTLFREPNFPPYGFPVLWKDGPPDQPYLTMMARLDNLEHPPSLSKSLERSFDIRFHVINRPNEVQLRSLIKALKNMSTEGIFTPRRMEWIGFADEGPSKDQNIEEAIDFRLFDSRWECGTSSSEQFGRSDDWIAKIIKQVHTTLNGLPAPYSSPRLSTDNERKVKIAIIDTGFDSEHPLFKWVPNNVSTHKHESFASRDRQGPGYDENGHGTHGTSVLSMLAPMAEIHVAKVVDGENYTQDMAGSVAAAIDHASNVWNVDIITMSFGFPYPTRKLETAIKNAGGSTLMFASASNDGANRATPITYPAREEGVFCVHSTDSYGKPSNFTPYHQPGMDNFATLGESVRAAWPTHDNLGLERRMSGTSTATPIVAAIAALILHMTFDSKEMTEEEHKKIKTYQGMRSVLLDMANPAGGYLYLNPVEFFKPGKNSQQLDPVHRVKKALERLDDP